MQLHRVVSAAGPRDRRNSLLIGLAVIRLLCHRHRCHTRQQFCYVISPEKTSSDFLSFSCVSLYGEFSRNCKLIIGFNDTSLFLQSAVRSTVYIYVKLNRYNPKVILLACFVIMAGLRLLQLCGLMGPTVWGALKKRLSVFQSFCENIFYVNSHMVNIK